MGSVEVDKLVEQLAAGFDALQDEYQKLFGKHSALERRLTTAREQYNELARLYRVNEASTPPLSLISSNFNTRDELAPVPKTTPEILDRSDDERSKRAANKIRRAIVAANGLRHAVPDVADEGAVKIWTGPSADNPEASSPLMPSIAESPLEQDFTVQGKPSQLGCPFASMAKKKLSSHAASVLSRYERNGSGGSIGTGSTPPSNASRVNGRKSFSQRRSRRASMLDPIKAEICGLSDHSGSPEPAKAPIAVMPSTGPPGKQIENADVGVCPIRFLDQHSPEEVATYFEKHKHELPRSHEVCVMRYQSNEEQIRQLDAKYGNLVSMIQGLGQKHKELLPEDIAVEDGEEVDGSEKALSDEKIRNWAKSVSAQAQGTAEAEIEAEERQSHFERPMREIRVGESPSRPWGIHVPAQYTDAESADGVNSKAAEIAAVPPATVSHVKYADATSKAKPAGKCPLGHTAAKQEDPGPYKFGSALAAAMDNMNLLEPTIAEPKTAFVVREPQSSAVGDKRPLPPRSEHSSPQQQSPAHAYPRVVINGPVFFGYSPEDTIRILKETGLKTAQP